MKTVLLGLAFTVSLSLTVQADYVLRCKGVGSDKSKLGAVGLYSSEEDVLAGRIVSKDGNLLRYVHTRPELKKRERKDKGLPASKP